MELVQLMKLKSYLTKYLDLKYLEQQNLHINLERSFMVLNPFKEFINFSRLLDSKHINIKERTFITVNS
jgi:hypothetical protein